MMMKQMTWKQCMELTRSIYNSRSGEWSHRIEGKKVRFERKVRAPNGQVRIFYRGVDCAGSYGEKEWNQRALPLETQQLTLF
jgi:hypothetical protein